MRPPNTDASKHSNGLLPKFNKTFTKPALTLKRPPSAGKSIFPLPAGGDDIGFYVVATAPTRAKLNRGWRRVFYRAGREVSFPPKCSNPAPLSLRRVKPGRAPGGEDIGSPIAANPRHSRTSRPTPVFLSSCAIGMLPSAQHSFRKERGRDPGDNHGQEEPLAQRDGEAYGGERKEPHKAFAHHRLAPARDKSS